MLQRLVDEVTKLLRADAADCYLLDRDRGVLRCAAVHGLDAALVGFEFPPTAGSPGSRSARSDRRDADDYERSAARIPHPAYAGFSRALVAPMVWAGETRGVLGVGLARRRPRVRRRATSSCSRRSRASRRSRSATPRASASARGRRASSAASTGSRSVLGEPLSLDGDARRRRPGRRRGARRRLRRRSSLPGPRRARARRRATTSRRRSRRRSASLPSAPRSQIGRRRRAHPRVARVADDERFGARVARRGAASLAARDPDRGAAQRRPASCSCSSTRSASSPTTTSSSRASLARAARGAFERSRLYEAERTARSLSQQLARTGSLLATELDPAAVLDEVVAQAPALLGADAGAIAPLEDDELVVTAAVGGRAPRTRSARASPATGWLGRRRRAVAGAGRARRRHVRPGARRGRRRCSPPATAPTSASRSPAARARSTACSRSTPREPRRGARRRSRRSRRSPRTRRPRSRTPSSTSASRVEKEQSVAILANIADGIVAVDREGQVVLWNAAAEQITGVPAAEALGRTPTQVLQREPRVARAPAAATGSSRSCAAARRSGSR